jgi:oxidoreductase
VRHLLDAIARENPGVRRLVHMSTVDVYGFPAEPCDENGVVGKVRFGYGETKRRGERLLAEYCAGARIPYTILRPANVIGPRSQFITRIGEALRSGVMLVVDGGRANAGLVYIDNLVDYIIWAARADTAIGECYNVRDPYNINWHDFVDKFRTAINGGGVVINLPFFVAKMIAAGMQGFHTMFLPAREPLLHPLLVNIFGRTAGHVTEKIRADSGFTGRIGFAEAVERSVRWFLDRNSGARPATRQIENGAA